MSDNIVRIQMEMFKPGVLVRGALMQLYKKPSPRYYWYPQGPSYEEEENGNAMRFTEGGILFHFVAIGTECDDITWGDIDFLMTLKPVGELFAESIPTFAELTQSEIQAFSPHSLWAILTVFRADMARQSVEFKGILEIDKIPEVVIPLTT